MRTMISSLLVLFTASTTLSSAASNRTLIVGGTDGNSALLPTGQYVTPTLAPGASYQRLTTQFRPDGNGDADSAMTSVVSPDGRLMAVLTSGFNCCLNYQVGGHTNIISPVINPFTGIGNLAAASALSNGSYGQGQSEFVFIYQINQPGAAILRQKVEIPDTYNGIAWDPAGRKFYVSGGIDDRILIYTQKTPTSPFVPSIPFIILGHNANSGPTAPAAPYVPAYHGGSLSTSPLGHATGPIAALVTAITPAATVAGFDISKDGKTLVAANFHNASVSIVDLTTRKVISDVVFTPPGSLKPIGEMPFWVTVKSNSTDGSYAKAYVTSQRDDQVVVVSGLQTTKVIPVPSGPSKSVLDPTGRYVYVVCGNDDSVAVIDTLADYVVKVISLARPGDVYKGAIPNSLTFSPDGKTLYVTEGGANDVAVVSVASGTVIGRIPTAWLPTSVSINPNGKYMYIVNEKSNAGPNPGNVYYSHNTPYGISTNPTLRNEYTWELEKSGLTSLPVPDAGSLSYLSGIVDVNNNFQNRGADPMAFWRGKIKHVIYIVNENRTYDQVLGDLGNGANGDPRLTFFTQPITPNLHALAAKFVTLDNFYDSSETSGVGWNWVMQGHTNDYIEKTQPVDYGNGANGFTYDWQGIVNNMNLGLPPTGPASIFTTRITGILDPSGASTILPGFKDPSATEGADNLSPSAIGGYIWESVLRLYGPGSVRNYGWNCDLNPYSYPAPFNPPLIRNPHASGTLESVGSTPTIQPITDQYYRAFDQNYPDIFRIEEWAREFSGYVKNNNLPALEVMTIPHDHTGSYGTAIEGLNTPSLELADHDYAIGQLVQAVSHSKYWSSTAIIMLEDDPQDGQDHVEAHRSIIHIISPYTQTASVVHTTYFTTSALRTVEDLLGVKHLGFQDSNALPISDAFSAIPHIASYTAIVPGSLCASPVSPDLVPACTSPSAVKTRRVADLHDGNWWAAATAGLDFTKPDHVNSQYYNAIMQYGMTGKGELPAKTEDALRSKNYDAGDAGDTDGDGR